MADRLEIISMNARGLGAASKRRKIFTWLQKQDMAIIMLQETHSSPNSEIQWRSEWEGEAYFSHGTSSARGSVVLFKPGINLEVHDFKADDCGRFVVLDITINDLRFTLCNIYGPNEDKPEFFAKVIEIVESYPNDNRLLGGDFNFVLNLDVDKKGGRRKTHTRSQELVLDWMEDTNLVDIWRTQHVNSQQFTYQTKYPTDIACRLDFFLVSFGLASYIKKSVITHGYLTDHSSIKLIVTTTMQKRGPGFWKMNTSLLRDQEYVNKIKEVIQDTVYNNGNADAALLWETIKLQCRGATIQYGSRKKKATKIKSSCGKNVLKFYNTSMHQILTRKS